MECEKGLFLHLANFLQQVSLEIKGFLNSICCFQSHFLIQRIELKKTCFMLRMKNITCCSKKGKSNLSLGKILAHRPPPPPDIKRSVLHVLPTLLSGSLR